MGSELRSDKLYKWQRITSKSVRRPERQVKTEAVTNDIEQWIKKVEQASDFAAAQAFGKARVEKSTKASILQTVDQLHDHDAAYDEAQELLNDWVQGHLSSLNDHSTEAAIWSDDDEMGEGCKFEPSIQSIIQQTDADALPMEEYERLMNLDTYDVHTATENVLDELRKREVVRPEFLYDLGDIGGQPTLPKPKKDPSVKMQIRQTQVKESRDKRRAEFKKKQEQEALRKEALNNVKQKAAEERRKTAQKSKHEEIEIQKEMSRIKKELQEERKEQLRKQEEEKEIEKRIALVAKAQAHAKKKGATENTWEDSPATLPNTVSDNERKKKIAKATEIAEARYVGHNLKLAHCCFNQWFDVVIQKRLQLGKARAVADWKSLFRAWNAWRHYTRECTLERLKVQHENSMLKDHRKLHQSHAHYEKKLLRKYWLQWHIWMAQERQAKELASGKNSVRQKMSAFLAAGRQLALDQQEVEQTPSAAHRMSQSHVDELFEHSTNRKAGHRSQTVKSRRLPTETWQVTRKHLKLTSKQINDLTDTPTEKVPEIDAFNEATSDVPSTSRTAASVPKSFQNRFNAQQKILQEQQKAIKEQKQMIEDLQFKQDKNLLEEQIKQQQAIQQQLENLTKLTLEDRKLNDVVPRPSVRNDEPVQDQEVPQTFRSQASSVSKTSGFSRKMDERAMERTKAKQEREERRRKQEQERIAEMVAKEEELRQTEADERKQRVEAFKEKRRLEKQRELELQQLKEKTISNQNRADEHSRLRVLKHCGFSQLKQHCEVMRIRGAEAKRKHTINIQRQAYEMWRLRYETNEAIRNEKSDDLYNRHLVKRCFKNWTQWRLQSQILSTKADRHYQSRLLTEVFKAWLDIATRNKIEMWEKERHARQHDILRLKTWAFNTWRHLPEERRKEEEKERRREEMRRKVANLLPDFTS